VIQVVEHLRSTNKALSSESKPEYHQQKKKKVGGVGPSYTKEQIVFPSNEFSLTVSPELHKELPSIGSQHFAFPLGFSP
jgi:hypothetical protein